MINNSFNPKVSIVIPVYNGSDFIREAIDSALAQTYKNIEIIVVNDGSNDRGKTERIVKSYGKKIKYLYKENGGVASALNMGIRNMTGEYFSWLSHDDVYYPDKITKQINYLRNCKNKNKILYGKYDIIDERSNYLYTLDLLPVDSRNFRYNITINNSLHGCTLLVPALCFKECGLFKENLQTTQDYDLWFRIAEKFEFIFIPDVLIKSRIHSNQGTNVIKDIAVKECNELMIHFLDNLSKTEITEATGKSIGISYYNISKTFKNRGFSLAEKYAIKKALTLGKHQNLYGIIKTLVYILNDLTVIKLLKNKIKNIFKKGYKMLKKIIKKFVKYFFKRKSIKTKFTEIYNKNGFEGIESVSGTGSDLIQTERIRKEIPKLIKEFKIKSILDAPCGDFYWMREVNLGVDRYIGVDIVKNLIKKNIREFSNNIREFKCIDIINGNLPRVDMIFCRDCLVHLSFDMAKKAINNFKRSGAKYLLTTTFTSRKNNSDLNGIWRTLNLEIFPFDFPKPIRIINEKCTEQNNIYTDKSLGLWLLNEIKFYN